MFVYEVASRTAAMGRRFNHTLSKLRSDKRGVTALEYGILAGLVAVVIVGSVTQVGTHLNTLFGNIAQVIQGVTG